MVHFNPAKKLPSAKEMAELILHHVFRLHGFPVDVVSDRVPHLPFLEGVLQPSGGDYKYLTRVPPTEQWQTERMISLLNTQKESNA